MVFYNEKEAGF